MGTASRITRNTFWLTLAYGLSRLLNLAMVVLLTRYLAPAGYGELTFAYAYQAIFLALADFGLESVLIREGSMKPGRLGQIIGNGIWLKSILALAAFLLCISTTLLLGYDWDKVLLTSLAAVALLFSPLSLSTVVFAAKLRLDRQARLSILDEGLRTAATLAAIALHADIVMIVAVRLLAAAIATGIYLYSAARLCQIDLRPQPRLWWPLLRSTIPLGLTVVLSLLNRRFGHLVIDRLLGETWLGVYGPGVQLSEILTMLVHLYFASAYPLLSASWAKSARAFRRLYWLHFRYVPIPAMLFAIGIIPLAGKILGLLGDPYLAGQGTLILLVWTQVLVYTATTFYYTCLAAGQFVQIGLFTLLALVINVILQITLIPIFGIQGAALAGLLAHVGSQVAALLLPSIRSYAQAWLHGMVRPTLAAGLTLLLIFNLPWLAFLLLAPVLYGLLLVLLGTFSPHRRGPLGILDRAFPTLEKVPPVELLHAPCPLCGERGEKPLYWIDDRNLATTEQRFRLVRCTHCGLVRLNPHPQAKDLARFYPEDYWQSDPALTPGKDPPYLPEEFMLLSQSLREQHGPIGGALLDIGCGRGEQIWPWQRAGWKVVGLDLSATAAATAREFHGLKAVVGQAARLPFPTDSFDVVTLYAVVEHLADPLAALREAVRVLKPDGVAAVLVPNIASLQARLFRSRWFALDAPRHLTLFTPETLQAALAQCGLEMVRLSYHSLYHNPAGYVCSLLPFHQYRSNSSSPWGRRLNRLLERLGRRLARWEQGRGSGGVMTAFAVHQDHHRTKAAPPAETGRYEFPIDLMNAFSSHTQLIWQTGWQKRVLEVGCATGFLSTYLIQHGCEVVGIEMDPKMAAWARRRGVDVIVGDAQNPAVQAQVEGSFQVILLGDVLEHLDDPGAWLRRVRSWLAPDGYVLLSVPNAGHWAFRREARHPPLPRRDRGLFDRGHQHFFNHTTLEQLARDCGYRIEFTGVTANTNSDDLTFQLLAPLHQNPGLHHWLNRLDRKLATWWPRLFGYQLIVRLYPTTGVDHG
jgi:O-antigen/teichoic acid export membrane protein/SAM-dependent methyltransferase